MERLEIKRIKGHEYYYYSKWGWENGKCRRLWQKYIGTAKAIIELAKGESSSKIQFADVFQFGLPIALWKECQIARVAEIVDNHNKKRDRGAGLGTYLVLASINRAISPVSKNAMWKWFSETSLVRLLPALKKEDLSSQQFWNNMDKIDQEDCVTIWKDIITKVISSEKIDLSSISYDGTNYYTFIDTFNVHCSIAKRGKNKQGRANLRQINYALFCTADGHIPLFYDTYEGNRNDYTQFPVVLKKFQKFFLELANSDHIKEKMTLVFDKGNCSKSNFGEIDATEFYFVTSTKLSEHPELTKISNEDSRFIPCEEDLDRTKAFRVTKNIHGKERVVVVTYNENLFECQWATLQTDIDKALEKLSTLSQKLEDRAKGLITGGRAPSQASIKKQCKEILSREYLGKIISCEIKKNRGNTVKIEFAVDQKELQIIADTYLGKNILLTNRENWSNDSIVKAYRSQYIIEGVFKESKDRKYGTWWPQYHWTDSKIHVHALYCTIALLLRATMKRRVENSGLKISMNRLLDELDDIREVVNFNQDKKKKNTETVLSRLSEIQSRLTNILGLSLEENSKLG
jgi:transposase